MAEFSFIPPKLPESFKGFRKGEVRKPEQLLGIFENPRRFRVRADDGKAYTIKLDEATGDWIIHLDGAA